MSTMSTSGALTAETLLELQVLEAYVRYMALDIPMLNAAKSEREWDWFFHKLEEGFLVASVADSQTKVKLARRFMRGRQLSVWCQLSAEMCTACCEKCTGGACGGACCDKCKCAGVYEQIRDEMYRRFFPQSEYFNSLMDLYSGHRDVESETPRRKMSLVGVKSVISTAKETMQRVAKRYNKEMPEESYWVAFAERLMTPAVKELFDQHKENMEASTPIEDMLNRLKDPNARAMRAPHKFRRAVRRQAPPMRAGKAKPSSPTTQATVPIEG